MDIKVSFDNLDFESMSASNGRKTIVNILREVADAIEEGDNPNRAFDFNGNTIATIAYKNESFLNSLDIIQ